jgi:hypothetical protein
MGKVSRRKQRQRADGHRERVRVAASVPAPNFEGAAVEAARRAIAMVTSAHASPEDLAGLIGDLAPDRARQGLVAYALVSELVMESARELADAQHITVLAAINGATADLLANEDEDMTALGRALGTVRNYAEVLDGLRPPETVTVAADLDANLGERRTAASYLTALTQIAHETVAARCAETGEGVVSYLQRISLPAAEAHGNEIDADAVERYVGALIDQRLADEPMLLTRAAEALRRSTVTLPDDCAIAFQELGGSGRLLELAAQDWEDMDADDQRLLVLALIDSIFVDPDGRTAGERVQASWRF